MAMNANHKSLSGRMLIQNQNITVGSSREPFEDISLDELLAFESQLYEDRTFAIVHPVGKKIFNTIKNWNKLVNFDDIIYYHARKLEDGHRLFLDQEMMKAPVNIASHGRYNAIGESCYYIAEAKEGQ